MYSGIVKMDLNDEDGRQDRLFTEKATQKGASPTEAIFSWVYYSS